MAYNGNCQGVNLPALLKNQFGDQNWCSLFLQLTMDDYTSVKFDYVIWGYYNLTATLLMR